jgi:hypothetical protein
VLEVKSIIGDAYFWLSLESFLEQMIPTIEASLMIQDGSCTLADVIYAICRLYQFAYRDEESAVVASLEPFSDISNSYALPGAVASPAV